MHKVSIFRGKRWGKCEKIHLGNLMFSTSMSRTHQETECCCSFVHMISLNYCHVQLCGEYYKRIQTFFASPALMFSQVMFFSDVLVSCVGGHMNFSFYLTDVYFLLLFVNFCYMDLVFYFGNCFFYNLHYLFQFSLHFNFFLVFSIISC